MYVRKDVNKRDVAGPGASVPKNPHIAVYLADDLVSKPIRDAAGVLMEGDFVSKPGKFPIKLYLTGNKQDFTFETEGDVDAEQIMPKLIGSHPGEELDAMEFYQNHLGKDLIIVGGNCSGGLKTVLGDVCGASMRMKGNFQANNEKTGFDFTFEQVQSTRFVPGKWAGEPNFDQPEDTDVSLDLLEATGFQYKVESLAVTAAITVASIDLPHGSKVTLIGSGGVGPATLSNGTLTGATAILKDGTQWVALAGSTITLEVYDDGTDIYLIERARTI